MKYIDVFPISHIHGRLHFLLLKRAADNSYPGIWQPVAGKIKPPETAWEAGLRELKEETGLTPQHFYALDHVSTYYLHVSDKIIHVPAFMAEVKPDQVLISDEHDAYEWLTLDKAVRTASWEPYRQALKSIPLLLTSSPALALAKITLKNHKNRVNH